MAKTSLITSLFAAALAMALPGAASAQQPLPVNAGAAWAHAHSGIVIPATLGGLARMRATSFAEPELDISQNFGSSDGNQQLTVYIFRNTNGAVPIWFAQAQRAISLREDLKNPALAIAPVAFTPPGQAAASGLKAVFAPAGVEGIRSTGVAPFAVGDWYVKMRATSATQSPGELSASMEAALSEIRLPQTGAAVAAEPIADCATKLAFTGNAADSALPAPTLTAGVQTPAPRLTAPRWCIDSVVGGNRAVYRPEGTADRYLLAIGDNGKAVAVQPHAAGYYSANFIVAAQIVALVAQDRLPTPQRALDLVEKKRAAGTTATWPPR
ncbi:hypothetical protein [Sphingopyxis macrogoltabida]|nr:hypothetical protein [Sphingopyxis macrogoltabida]